MNKTRQIIDEYKKEFPEFQYYHNIIDKIEENIEKMPDISIESCKSLIEGSSKTILKRLGVTYQEAGRNADGPRDLLKKVLDNIYDSVPSDPDFISKSCSFVTRMNEIRNKCGDISHGKPSPKDEESDKHLAEFVAHITDGVMSYLLKIYFRSDLSYLKEVKYEDNPEFNDFLDGENQIEGIVFSRALFDQDPISYEDQLNNYKLDNIKE